MIDSEVTIEEKGIDVDRSRIYSNEATSEEPKAIPAKNADDSASSGSLIKTTIVKCLIILATVGVLYLVQFGNKVTNDGIDRELSLYPRNIKKIYGIFTCTFVHDDFSHLNSLVLLFTLCAVGVILRGNKRFFWISCFVIFIGNCLSWCIGSNRMNGCLEWICGLLAYIYFSIITDFGYPIKFSMHGCKALVLAVVITIVLIFMYSKQLIKLETSCWQYQASGVVAGVISAYLFTSTPLAYKLGIISKERYEEASAGVKKDPEAAEPQHRVVVGKNLVSFNDLRKPLIH